jgi:hypothetical protein
MGAMNAHSPIAAAKVRASPGAAAWQERPAIVYPLLILLAVLLVIPANLGGPMLHDNFAINWVWADQFTAALAKGNLYPRWMPLSDDGLGAPVFYFYPPLGFHLAGLFGLLGFSTYYSLIAGYAAAFAASGIACWHWLKGRSNHPLLAAAFFVAAPYHLYDFTVRGALSESVGIAFIPLIAIGLRRIAEQRGGVVFAALAYGGLICTHLPLALLVSIFLSAPYALLHRQHLPDFAIATVIGIGLAGIYLVPAFALQDYRDLAQLYRSPGLRTDYWSIYSFHWDQKDYATVFAIIAALILTAARPAVRLRDGWARYAIAVALVTGGIIPFVWSLPLLHQVQFPFRALPLAEFGLATAVARLPRGEGFRLAPIELPLLLSLFILPGFHLEGDVLQRLQSTHPDVYEYLPKGVITPRETSVSLREVLSLRVPPPHVTGMVVEPHFYFPAWSCGTEEPRTQLLMHEPSCKPRITWTMAEKIGAAISLIAGLLLAGWTFRRRSARVC